MIRKMGALLILAGLATMLLPLTAVAHSDGGVDETFISPDMNQETYWEARWDALGDVSCTKYNNHSGSIPSGYEAVVIHDAQLVRVYGPDLDGLGAFTALGPHNPNSPTGAHYGSPHSWAMKCDIVPPDTDYSCVEGQVVEVADGQGEYETIEEAQADCGTTTTESTTTTLPGCEQNPEDPACTTTTTSTPGCEETPNDPACTTTTTAPTTTVPNTVAWDGGGSCHTLTASWEPGEGIVQVDVWMRDINGDLGPADGLVPITTPGQVLETGEVENTTFVLIPVTEGGAVANPEQREFTIPPCEVEVGDITAVCVSDIPFLSYDVEFEDVGLVDITFVNPDGEDITFLDQPTNGFVIWPGASVEPPDWPGWILEDGIWSPGDDGFLWARETVTVIFELNPSVEVQVDYPPASAICADPENPPPSTSPTGSTLPFTGIDNGLLVGLGASALALGALLLFAVRREET